MSRYRKPFIPPDEWTTVPQIAALFSTQNATVRRWIRTGRLKALDVPLLHYSDERPRKTNKCWKRVHREELVRFMEAHYGPGPKAIRKASSR